MDLSLLLRPNMRTIGKTENLLPPFNKREAVKAGIIHEKDNIMSLLSSSPIGDVRASVMSGYGEAVSRFVAMRTNVNENKFGGYATTPTGEEVLAEMNNRAAALYDPSRSNDGGEKILMCYKWKGVENPLSACVIGTNGEVSRYVVSADMTRDESKHTAVALVYMQLCIIAFFSDEVSTAEELIRDQLEELVNETLLDNEERAFYLFRAVSHNIYSFLSNFDQFESRYKMNWLAEMPTDPVIPMLDLSKQYPHKPENTIGVLNAFDSLAGKIEPKKVLTPARIKTIGDLAGSFDPDPTRVRTDEELSLLDSAKYVDKMIPSKELLYIASLIQKSSNSVHAFRNFILRGPAGTGKSTMVQQLSRLLNIPAVIFEMSPDTDKLDLTLSAIPAASTAKKESIADFMKQFPAAFEWAMDPEESYQKITGEYKEGVTAADCEAAILSMYQAQNSGERFTYVESQIIRAVRNGWIVEVQEPTICQRPGVLASLNSLSDDGQTVELMTGEIVHRHKDSIIVYTTNNDYEGCYPLNQSQLSRFSVLTINLPDKKEVIKRLEQQSGLFDKKILNSMYAVYDRCRELAESKGITDGAIDFRALLDWATAVALIGDVYENGKHMFIEKCTSDQTLQKEFLDCLDSEFVPDSK